MKYIKRLICILIAAVLCCNMAVPADAFSRKEHDKQLSEVLFKTFCEPDNDNELKDKAYALKCAAYLAIDQYNGNGNTELDFLKNFGVEDLPASISEIDYSAGPYHRRKTHRGWNGEDSVYIGDESDRWEIRKKILVNTCDKVFDSKGSKAKREALCAVIYYTHVLGDRMADNKYYPNADIMELGGRTDDQDIISELLKYIEILFDSNKHPFKYLHVTSKLQKYDKKVSKLIKRTNGKIEGEDFAEYKSYAEKIMEVLNCNIPEMLKDEGFFNEAFYN